MSACKGSSELIQSYTMCTDNDLINKRIERGFIIKFRPPARHCNFTMCMSVANNYHINNDEIIIDEQSNLLLSKYLQLRRIPYTDKGLTTEVYEILDQPDLSDYELYQPYIKRIVANFSVENEFLEQQLSMRLNAKIQLDRLPTEWLRIINRIAVLSNCYELVKRILKIDRSCSNLDTGVGDINVVGLHIMMQFQPFVDHYGFYAIFRELINKDYYMNYCTLPQYQPLWKSVNVWGITNPRAIEFIELKLDCNEVLSQIKSSDDDLYKICQCAIVNTNEIKDEYIDVLIKPFIDSPKNFGICPVNATCLLIELIINGLVDISSHTNVHPCLDHINSIVKNMRTKSSANVMRK